MSSIKVKNSNIPNNVNIMSCPITGHTFLGLLEIADVNQWGLTIEQRNYCGAHLLSKQVKKPILDDKREEKLVKEENFTVLLLLGLKEICYFKRFKDKKAALQWIHNKSVLNSDQDAHCFRMEETVKED